MRFFRVPAFTGIEVHRDDADRGSLRVVEGCVPHGPGGLRSGPVWSSLGDVDTVSNSDENLLHAMDDGKGNSVILASRNGEVHDMRVVSTENTSLDSLNAPYGVVLSSPYDNAKASIAPIGNRLYGFGDGTEEAVLTGKGPIYRAFEGDGDQYLVFPDAQLYRQEWSRFPNCQFFVPGPKKTIFAAGNPEDPLVVYISEPAGMTQPVRDAPYSTEENSQTPGLTNSNVQHPYMGGAHHGENEGMSTVRILGSDATRISALSTRGDKIVVHTDKGCHILYAPSGDQASTGYRTEQITATNTSAAVNAQTVAGDGGTQPFWLGFDGQIYKDEAAVRGAEDFKSFSDPQQASWKAKGKWEREQPHNLENSFATYDPQSGMYWVFIESAESALAVRKPVRGPGNLKACQPDHTGVCPTGCSALLGNVPRPVPAVNWRISDTEEDPEDIEYWDGSVLEMSADLESYPINIGGTTYYQRYTHEIDPSTGERFDFVTQINNDIRLDYYASTNATRKFAYVGRNYSTTTLQFGYYFSSGYHFALQDDGLGICFMHGLPAGSVPPASGPTNLLGSQAQQAPTSGPTNLLGSQAQQAPANGPTGLTGSQAQQAPANGPTGLIGAQDTSGTCSDLDELTAQAFTSTVSPPVEYDGSVLDMTRYFSSPTITIGGVTLKEQHSFYEGSTDKAWDLKFNANGNIEFMYSPFTDASLRTEVIGTWTTAGMNLDQNWEVVVKSDGLGVCVGHGIMNMQPPANGPTQLIGAQQHIANGPTNLLAVQGVFNGSITRNFEFPSNDYLTAPLGIDQWTVSGEYVYCSVQEALSATAYGEYTANRLNLTFPDTSLIGIVELAGVDQIAAVNIGIYHSQLPLSFTIQATYGGVTETTSATWTKTYTSQPPAPQLNAQIITPNTSKDSDRADVTRTFVKGDPTLHFGNGSAGDPPVSGTVRMSQLVSSNQVSQAHNLIQYNFFEPTTIYRYEIFGLFMSGDPWWNEQQATFTLRYTDSNDVWHDVESFTVSDQTLDVDVTAAFTATRVAIWCVAFGVSSYSRIDYLKLHTEAQIPPVNGPTEMRFDYVPDNLPPNQIPITGPTSLTALQDFPICVSNTSGGHDGTYEITRNMGAGNSIPFWTGPSGKEIYWSSSTSKWYCGFRGQTSGASLVDTGDGAQYPWQCTWGTISVTTGDCTP